MVFCFLFSALVLFSFVGLARFIIIILYNCSAGTFARFVKYYLYNRTIVVEQRTPRRALISIGMSSRRHPQPGFPPHNLLCPISHPVSPSLFVRFPVAALSKYETIKLRTRYQQILQGFRQESAKARSNADVIDQKLLTFPLGGSHHVLWGKVRGAPGWQSARGWADHPPSLRSHPHIPQSRFCKCTNTNTLFIYRFCKRQRHRPM